jgi:hypothetical protein
VPGIPVPAMEVVMKIVFALLLLLAAQATHVTPADAQSCPKGRLCGAVCCP